MDAPRKIKSTLIVIVEHYSYNTSDRLENLRHSILDRLFHDDGIFPVSTRGEGEKYLKILKENLGKGIKVYNTESLKTWNLTEFGLLPAHLRIDLNSNVEKEGYFFVLDKGKKLAKLYVIEVFRFISNNTDIKENRYLMTKNIKAYIVTTDKTTDDVLKFLLGSKLIQSPEQDQWVRMSDDRKELERLYEWLKVNG